MAYPRPAVTVVTAALLGPPRIVGLRLEAVVSRLPADLLSFLGELSRPRRVSRANIHMEGTAAYPTQSRQMYKALRRRTAAVSA